MAPAGRVLPDTNVIIALFAGEASVLSAVASAEAVYVPAVALGELYFGACKSGRPAENVARVAEFARAALVLSCDVGTASMYGEIKVALRASGTPIPENDVWIAAVARQHGLTLATRDGHFGHVAGLEVTDWT